MAKARRTALVPEDDVVSIMAEERKINKSPLVKSLANTDQEIKIILKTPPTNTTRPKNTTLRQHHESIQSHS